MPGTSIDALPPLTAPEEARRDRLHDHVHELASQIGERNRSSHGSLPRARDYIATQFQLAGYDPVALPFEHDGETFHNVEAVLPGRSGTNRSLVVGAHYDSVEGSPGANDNASGVAALLELARQLKDREPERTVRFVAFANEEPPYFNTGIGMGSVEYVRSLGPAADNAYAMLSLETVGLYSDEPGSQRYPPLVGSLYPDRGNFIAFVGDTSSRDLVREAVGAFRSAAVLPSEGAALPSVITGVSWSDHRSFSQAGVPAIMVTDTAPFRDPHYHLATDTPGRLDYARMARLVTGLEQVVAALTEQARD